MNTDTDIKKNYENIYLGFMIVFIFAFLIVLILYIINVLKQTKYFPTIIFDGNTDTLDANINVNQTYINRADFTAKHLRIFAYANTISMKENIDISMIGKTGNKEIFNINNNSPYYYSDNNIVYDLQDSFDLTFIIKSAAKSRCSIILLFSD